jgi:hypothetical protein
MSIRSLRKRKRSKSLIRGDFKRHFKVKKGPLDRDKESLKSTSGGDNNNNSNGDNLYKEDRRKGWWDDFSVSEWLQWEGFKVKKRGGLHVDGKKIFIKRSKRVVRVDKKFWKAWDKFKAVVNFRRKSFAP